MQIKLLMGLNDNLSAQPIIGGQLLFVTDTGKIYLDTAGTKDAPGADTNRVELYKIPLDAVSTAVTTLNTLVGDKSVATQISEKINTLNKEDTAVANQFVTQVSEVNGVISVVRAALAEADIPALAISKITGLQDALDGKQDNIVFNTTYNAETNKAATMQDVETVKTGLTGAMHFVGVSSSDPSTGTVTVTDVTTFKKGDVVLYNKQEFVYDGSVWHLFGDEGSYAVKGSIVNADIATNAAIEISKIADLGTKLTNLEGTDSDTKDSKSVKGAKLYADDKIAALDVNDAAVSGQFVTEVKQENGKVIVKREALAVDSLVWGEF